MTTRTQRVFVRALVSLCLALTACDIAPRTTTDTQAANTQRERAALRELERTTASTTNALRAIDAARDVVAYNIKNAHMTAFKRSRAILQEGGNVEIHQDFSQGSIQTTGRPLDISIEGTGFFQLLADTTKGDPARFTRLGTFFVNTQGLLILRTREDFRLDPPIRIPPNTTEISIEQDGRVLAQVPGNETKTTIGQIQLARFINEEGLFPMGSGLFERSETSGSPQLFNPGSEGMGVLMQGAVEESNVDLTEETIRLEALNRWRNALLHAAGVDY